MENPHGTGAIRSSRSKIGRRTTKTGAADEPGSASPSRDVPLRLHDKGVAGRVSFVLLASKSRLSGTDHDVPDCFGRSISKDDRIFRSNCDTGRVADPHCGPIGTNDEKLRRAKRPGPIRWSARHGRRLLNADASSGWQWVLASWKAAAGKEKACVGRLDPNNVSVTEFAIGVCHAAWPHSLRMSGSADSLNRAALALYVIDPLSRSQRRARPSD